MKRHAASAFILGVTATSKAVYAVMVEDAPEGPVIVQQFYKPRAGSNPYGPVVRDVDIQTDSDVSFQFGESADATATMFLEGEFGSESTDDNHGARTPIDLGTSLQVPFASELMAIVSDCEEAGYTQYRIVFAIGSGHVSTTLLELHPEDRAGKDKSKSTNGKTGSNGKQRRKNGGPSNDEWIAALQAVTGVKVDKQRVAFVPMKPGNDGTYRSLAVVTSPSESVTPTMEIIRNDKKALPTVDLLDTEATLLLGLARAACLLRATSAESDLDGATHPENDGDEDSYRILLVRAGVEDTLVMFLEGETLVHYESLRSITAFDSPETICSRVLLLQDEFGTTDADLVVLLAEDREESLLERFRTFFPETRVETVRKYLPATEPDNEEPVAREALLASIATLRRLNDDLYQAVFEETNFLSKDLLKKRAQLPFSWSIAAMYVVLFVSSLFFVYRYFTLKHEIEIFRYELKNYPQEVVEANATVLQGRIDSLKSVSANIAESMDILDSLLIGADRWSRVLEKTAKVSADVRGLWIEQWREDNNILELDGTATNRDEVVSFAARTDATIQTLSFSEIRGWPVYSFTMHLKMPEDLPEAAKYLREHVVLEPQSDEFTDAVSDAATGR